MIEEVDSPTVTMPSKKFSPFSVDSLLAQKENQTWSPKENNNVAKDKFEIDVCGDDSNEECDEEEDIEESDSDERSTTEVQS